MPAADEPTSGDGGEEQQSGITRRDHARLRATHGRPISEVVNDIQRAGPRDVLIESNKDRFVVRGPKGREHILEQDGEHITSVRRPNAAHQARLRAGTIRAATDEECQKLKAFVK